MSTRKALIGYSSPVGYYYDLEREGGYPGPILESPISLLLFYDELWFMSRDLCPYNMQDLDYVHFVDEDLMPDGLPADFSTGLEDPVSIRDFPWKYWERTIHTSFLPDSRYDNHARSRGFGELSVLPTPGSYSNFLVDHYVAHTNGLDLIENSVNSEWLANFEQELLDLHTSESLIAPRLPSVQSLEGPYHPVIDDLRSDSLLKSYRTKISEVTSGADPEDINRLAANLAKEYERISAELTLNQVGKARVVDGTASLTLGQLPVISNIVSAIQGLRQLLGAYKDRRDRGWVGFIARAVANGDPGIPASA